ncbi:MAG: hypothetical protein QHC79_25810 [Pseudosphingobacterium sp.]|nr:hypothetical protein [Pseudosphingobacterium sp.]
MKELIGMPVMVHPQLTKDPYNERGNVGIILSSNPDHDDNFVGFSEKKLGVYASDALLVLKPADMLMKARSIHSDFIDIDKVIRHILADHPDRAMNVVRSNPTILDDVTMSLAEYLERGLHELQQRENKGRSR